MGNTKPLFVSSMLKKKKKKKKNVLQYISNNRVTSVLMVSEEIGTYVNKTYID